MLNVDSEEVKELAAKLKKLVNEVESGFLNRYDCTLAYERGGHAYLAAFTGKDPKSHKQACDELIDMVSPQK